MKAEPTPPSPQSAGPDWRQAIALALAGLVLTAVIVLSVGHFWGEGAATVVAGVCLAVLLLLGGYSNIWPWLGFGPSVTPKGDTHEVHPAKTIWDWLQLLIVPAVLTVGGLWYAAQQSAQDQKQAYRQHQLDQAVARDDQRSAVLDAYLDRMADLMLTRGLASPHPPRVVLIVAQTRTLTALRRLDTPRQNVVLRLLADGALFHRLDLSGADLHGINLAPTFYTNRGNTLLTNLHGAHLSFTNLSRAHLLAVDLSGADLKFASLPRADLGGARLVRADMRDADLAHVSLRYADLRDADLEAADLGGADLTGARLSKANLHGAQLHGATMPNGSTHP